jgi:hypothetical protein
MGAGAAAACRTDQLPRFEGVQAPILVAADQTGGQGEQIRTAFGSTAHEKDIAMNLIGVLRAAAGPQVEAVDVLGYQEKT